MTQRLIESEFFKVRRKVGKALAYLFNMSKRQELNYGLTAEFLPLDLKCFAPRSRTLTVFSSHAHHSRLIHFSRKSLSDVNKDLTFKAKARTKDLAFKTKARTKDLT